MSQLEPILNLFRYHKMKIFAFVVMTLMFFVLLFPYSDLGDLVSVKVAEATQNQVYVRFGDMGFTVLPRPGIAFKEVYAESAFFPALEAKVASIAPSFGSLIRLKPGGSVFLEKFLNGNVSASLEGNGESSKGSAKYLAEVELESIALQDLMKLINSPISVNGALAGESSIDVDPDFADQPEGDFEIKINKFHLPYSTIDIDMNGAKLPFNIPELKISNLNLKGRMVKGEIYIDELRIGNKKDELNGLVRGRMNMKLTKRGVQFFPQFGRYNFSIDIVALPSFLKKLGAMAGILDGFLGKFKFTEVGGTRYALKMSGNRFGPVPRMEPLK